MMKHKSLLSPRERPDGTKEWFDGFHRVDGPAVEWPDGTKGWYLNGQRHRVDGPAYERPDGYKEWYLNDNKCSEEIHRALTQGPIENLLLYLHQGFDEYIEQRLK